MKKLTCKTCGKTVDTETAKKQRWHIEDGEVMCFECIKAETLEQLEAERALLNDEYKQYNANFNCGVC